MVAFSLRRILAFVSAVAAAEYDVIIYGATSGGVAAAVAAARHGMRVAVVNPGTHVGGLSSSGLGRTDTGGHTNIIGGIAGEFYAANAAHYGEASQFNLEPHVAKGIFRGLLSEAGVELINGASVAGMTKRGAKLQALSTTDGRRFTAKVFIDASYEGDLMPHSGVSTTFGREGRARYNESLAGRRAGAQGHEFSVRINPFDEDGKPLPSLSLPISGAVEGAADGHIQSYNFRLCVTKNHSNLVPFQMPEEYNPADWEFARRYFNHPDVEPKVHAPCGDVVYPCGNPIPGNKWDLNNGGPISTDFIGGNAKYAEAGDEEREAIWLAHKRYTQSFLYFMSNDGNVSSRIKGEFQQWGLCRDEFQDTDHWPPLLYVREVRRLVSDQVFTQNTPFLHRTWGNLSIGMGGYNFDAHNAQRLACRSTDECLNGPPGTGPYMWNEGDVETSPGIYEIPLWVVLPRRSEAENLLVAAAPSASHIGMSTLRMEPQFMIMGHSAGVVAALAVNGSQATQDVDTRLLHTLLEADGQFLSLAPTPTPPPASDRYLVTGAGTAEANGEYLLNSSEKRDDGTFFYSLDDKYQLYRYGGVWRLAWSSHTVLYTSSISGETPPVIGWVVSGNVTGLNPAPTVAHMTKTEVVV